MKYIIWASQKDDTEVQYTGLLEQTDADYLLTKVIPLLRPMSIEEYHLSLTVILTTAAHSSYILDGTTVYWCVEWDPGFIVVKFTSEESIEAVAIRSPVPDFGGREALDEDWETYDEDDDNPQYNLIFTPWDAQFDEQKRQWDNFTPASEEDITHFNKALEFINSIDIVHSEEWAAQCNQNIDKWAGEGHRIKIK